MPHGKKENSTHHYVDRDRGHRDCLRCLSRDIPAMERILFRGQRRFLGFKPSLVDVLHTPQFQGVIAWPRLPGTSRVNPLIHEIKLVTKLLVHLSFATITGQVEGGHLLHYPRGTLFGNPAKKPQRV